MLRKDIKRLKLILGMLFYSANYFRIKKDGSIIVKKEWYSLKRLEITLEEVFNKYIPNCIGLDSDDTVIKYQEEMSTLMESSIDKRLRVAFNSLSNFINETEYKGCMLDWDFQPNFRNKLSDYLKEIREDVVEYYHQTMMEIEFRSTKFGVTSGNSVVLSAMPATSVISVQEILNRQREKISFNQIGKVITGDPDFDSHIQRIYRIASANPGFT